MPEFDIDLTRFRVVRHALDHKPDQRRPLRGRQVGPDRFKRGQPRRDRASVQLGRQIPDPCREIAIEFIDIEVLSHPAAVFIPPELKITSLTANRLMLPLAVLFNSDVELWM